jgi:hypothetical protein
VRERRFTQIPLTVGTLLAIGDRLLTESVSAYPWLNRKFQLWDSRGMHVPIPLYTGFASYDPVESRLFGIDWESDLLVTAEIDSDSAEVIGGASTSVRVDQTIPQQFIRVSADGSRVILNSGQIFDTETLVLQPESLTDPIRDALWLPDGGLLTIRQAVAPETFISEWRLEYRDRHFQLADSKTLDLFPVRLVSAAGKVVVVHDAAPGMQFEIYSLPDGP